MVGVERITNAAPFARDGLSGGAGVQLDVDLRMAGTDFSSSLNYESTTRQRTTESLEYTTGTLWMRYSPLLR